MTGQDEQERHDRWKALGIRTDIPHPARVYDYLLGGKDNFAVDREAAEMSLKISPEILDSARANRQFLVRTVRFLRDNGIRQFLDVGDRAADQSQHLRGRPSRSSGCSGRLRRQRSRGIPACRVADGRQSDHLGGPG